ncbi:Glutamate synthase [NADPH] large chain [Myxococcus hansupus]|uniref:Glutamate synthase [NADPH] large chain n=1 Tax=Pseudomyxococcus hansupus TaxID=1297742 RepID=A0A0H4X7Q4_9BACT|nr:B-box zinc finger protein [Myxococcus hansupus]AKQ69605.1 Glutamate synthase [NADPH] large chain [Myxococcus hansupus]
MTPTGAVCGNHPDVPAVATCMRCGTFLCGDCTELVGQSPYCACAPCVAIMRKEARPSRVVQVALALNVVGLVCLPCSLTLPLPTLVAGLAGVVLGLRELHRIARGEGAERGRNQARVTTALGWVNLGLAACWMTVLLFGDFQT